MHQVGGKDWEDWYRAAQRHASAAPKAADGSWSTRDSEGVGPVYQTAIAVIVMSIPMNYLPIYQR